MRLGGRGQWPGITYLLTLGGRPAGSGWAGLGAPAGSVSFQLRGVCVIPGSFSEIAAACLWKPVPPLSR